MMIPRTSMTRLVVVWALVLAACSGTRSLWGQQPGPEAGGPAAGDEETVIREQTIYIPYEKLQKTFEKEGRGVFLPYKKFQELWQAARERTESAQPPERPVDALINSIENEATIGDQVVNVAASLQVEILGKGWVKIPLRLRHSAVRAATIDGRPARIIFDSARGHELLYDKQDEEPLQIELKLEYSRKFEKTPGQSSVVFEAPQAPINRWRVRVPEASMAVQIEPMIAATRDAPEGATDAPADLLAFVGAAPTVRIAWNPKAEGASGLTAFATVQVEQQVVISEGVDRSTIKLDYDISRATLTQLVLEVPSDQKVVNVVDRNVKRWDVEVEEGRQVIRVELFEATQGSQSLVLELERFTDATLSTYDVTAAVVRALDVGRQQGIVVVRLDAGLQGEAVQRTGLLQLDQNDLPPALKQAQWGFVYRYGAVPYELTLRVEKVLPRISVTELIDTHLETNRLTLDWQGLYQIDDAGLFQLRLDIPADYEVRDIQGQAIGEAAAVAVDSFHRAGEDTTTWIVNLSQRAFGKVGLMVRLERALSDPNLLAPTGNASTISVPLPRAHQEDVEFAEGSLVLGAPQSLRVNPASITGLRSISFIEAYAKIPAAPARSPQIQPVLAYSFAKGDTEFSVTAQRRKPQVSVDQLLQVEIESGVVKFDATFFYSVRYSGVKSLRIDIPTSLAGDVRNTNKAVRREQIAPQPDDVAEGYTAWSFAAETELLGDSQVNLVWEEKIEELTIGASQDIAIPRLIPMNVDLATGQIVVGKSESIDVQPTTGWKGLIPIDPHNDLRHPARIENPAMAFTFVDQWELQIRATRYELEDSQLTSIDRAVVRIVVLEQGELSIQALYRMRSARQRLAIRLPSDAEFDAQPLRIDGKPVSAERESPTTISAPLLDQDLNDTFVLELRYSTAGTPDQLDLPWLPDEPAIQKVFVSAHLPEKKVLLASSGSWSNEQVGIGLAALDPAAYRQRNDLIGWVTEGNPAAANSAQSFAVGKTQQFVYSTLRPEDAPDGSLSLKTTGRRFFNGVVLLVIASLGLPLFRRGVRSQLALLLLLCAGLLLIGVFVPELAHTLLGSIFPAAVALLILLWLVGHISRLPWSRRTAAAEADEPASSGDTPPMADGGVPPAAAAPSPPPAESDDDDAQDKGGKGNA